MPTTNVVQAILGRRSHRIKWDATWNLIAWLLDPSEGHGLADGVLGRFTEHVFGHPLNACASRTEVNLGLWEDGKTRWPDLVLFFPNEDQPTHLVLMDDVDVRSPNSKRKLSNLLAYGRMARVRYPEAIVKVVAITNALNGSCGSVNVALERQMAANSGSESFAWNVVRLQSIGEWTAAALESVQVDDKVRRFLSDFVDWSAAAES